MLISILVGMILTWIGVLNSSTRKVVSDVNYYVLVPVYSWIYIFQAIQKDNLIGIGLVIFCQFCCFTTAFILMMAVVFLFMKTDIRCRFSYSFVMVFMNAAVMPLLLATSTCDSGGKFANTIQCKNSMIKQYIAATFISINFTYWGAVLPLLQYEKQLAMNTKKAIVVILNYYESVNAFLNDAKFETKVVPNFYEDLIKSALGLPSTERQLKSVPTSPQTSYSVSIAPLFNSGCAGDSKDVKFTSQKLPVNFENDRFIDDYYTCITSSQYEVLMSKYEDFYKTKLIEAETKEEEANLAKHDPKRKDTQIAYQIIEKEILIPNNLLIPQEKDDICSKSFYYRRLIRNPPAVASIIGLIMGFIFPLNSWFFDPDNQPLPTFIATVQTVGGMMSPVSMFLLGTYLAQVAIITKEMFITWKHIIVSNIVKNIIMPLIGFLFVFVIIKGIAPDIFYHNKVLTLILYTFWMVPNGIVLIGVYVVADYFAKEFAVISVYLNLVSIPMMTIYLIIYFFIYESYVKS
jgi:predicted permease